MGAILINETALELFRQVCIQNVNSLSNLAAHLAPAGFHEVQRRPLTEMGRDAAAVLYRSDAHRFGFVGFEPEPGKTKVAGLVLHDSPETRAAMHEFIKPHPRISEVTREAHRNSPLMRGALRVAMYQSRFWTTKASGQMGMTLGIMPAIVDLDGAAAFALTVERNVSLADPPTSDEIAALIGPGSLLQRAVSIFTMVGMAHAPDPQAIALAAQAQGFGITAYGENSFSAAGGKGQAPKPGDFRLNIQVNRGSTHKFEFALFFDLNPQVTASQIRNTFASGLGLSQGLTADGVTIHLRSSEYHIRHTVHNATFGNHYITLQS